MKKTTQRLIDDSVDNIKRLHLTFSNLSQEKNLTVWQIYNGSEVLRMVMECSSEFFTEANNPSRDLNNRLASELGENITVDSLKNICLSVESEADNFNNYLEELFDSIHPVEKITNPDGVRIYRERLYTPEQTIKIRQSAGIIADFMSPLLETS